MTTVAIVLAAGRGERLGADQPKALVALGGRPMVAHSLAAIAQSGVIDRVILVLPAGRHDDAVSELQRSFAIAEAVQGGRSRQESVRLGLDRAGAAEIVVCHDAARPFASPALYRRVLTPLAHFDGVVPVVPVHDTVKVVVGGMVERTVPRDALALVQTPQAFRAEALRDAHRRAAGEGLDATDDAMLLEGSGYRVAAVEGEEGNFKITSRRDLERAEAVLSRVGGRR